MDVVSTRHRNFLALIASISEKQPRLLQREIALALNLDPSYYAQLKAGKKMGDETARKIEAAYKLSHGWLDVPRNVLGVAETTGPYGTSQPLRIDPDTIAAALRLVRLSFLNLGLEIDQEENGEPLALAYDYLCDRNEVAVTPDNLLEFKPRLAKAIKQGGSSVEEQSGDRASRKEAS